MPDAGHLETEALLRALEKRIAAEYRKANKEIVRKVNAYMNEFKRKDKEWKKKLENEEITEAEYKAWQTGQVMIGKRWEEMRKTLAQDYGNVNDIAQQMTKNTMPEVYALNHNYATFEAEKGGKVDTSYTLYDRATVERLIRDDPKLLPDPRPESPLGKKLAKNKELRWEEQHVQSAVLQSILQGEDLEQTAKRFSKLTEMNYHQSVRYARTSTTGAQNAGRVDGYKRAEKLGVNMKQVWLATLDGRTRHEHRVLDGQKVDIGKPFKVAGFEIKYPGDPAAPAHLLYNCRCTVIGEVDGIDFDLSDKTQRDDKIGDMTYEQWKDEKRKDEKPKQAEKPKEVEKPAPEKPKFTPATTKQEAEEYAHRFAKDVNYNGVSLENVNIINETLTTLTEKYPINQLEAIKPISRGKAVMSACYGDLNIAGRKLGLVDEGTERFIEMQEYTKKLIQDIKDRYKDKAKLPPGIATKVKKLEYQLQYSRWNVSENYENKISVTVMHEYGHIIADQYFGQINHLRANPHWREDNVRDFEGRWNAAFKKAKETGDIFKLSQYGASNSHEFFAESFAAREMGEKLPDYVESLMKEVLDNGIM